MAMDQCLIAAAAVGGGDVGAVCVVITLSEHNVGQGGYRARR